MSLIDGVEPQDPQDPQDPTAGNEPPADPTPPAEGDGWFYADGVAGDGDRPEWFQSKYGSVEEQAKAYPELAKKFGGFTGAPEGDYELSVPEGVEGDFDLDDPRLVWFNEIAKEANMSQDTFTQMLHGWVQHEIGVGQTSQEEEIKALGADAQSRLKDLGDWGQANLSEEEFGGFREIASTAQGVKTLEAMIAKTKQNGVANTNATPNPGITKEILDERIADPKYKTSASFRKETQKMFEQFYGE